MGQSKDTVVINKSGQGRHRGSILEIIATLEQYSLCEKEAGSLPEETVTRVTLVNFFEVGARHGFFTSIPLLISAPLGFAVLHKLLPVFGKSSLSLWDKIFALALSGLPALATIMFLGVMFSLLHYGNITKKGVSILFQGLLLGKAIGHFLVFISLHIIYYFVVNSQWLYKYIYDLSKYKIINTVTAKKLAFFIYSLGDPIIQSAWYTVGLFILAVFIMALGSQYGKYRTKAFLEFKTKWLLD